MFKFTKSFTAVALAVTAIAASAQEGANRADMFGQESSSAGEAVTAPAPAAARRVRIANTATPAGAAAQAAAEAGNGVIAPKALARQGVDKSGELSEFQKFISDNTGKVLPIFGAEFLQRAATFAPILNSPVPTDYPLGPGDELMIRGWGSIDIDFKATIDRNGTINIPTIGSVVLAGVKAGEAENVIRNAVARL